MKKLFSELFELLTVSKCPSCGRVTRRSGTFCPECLEKYKAERAAECPFCKMRADVCVCSVRDLYFCRELDGTMKSLLFYMPENSTFSASLKSLKYSPDRGVEKIFARELARELLILMNKNGEYPEEWCITFPPRRKNAVRRYGFDQSRGLAKRTAKYTGMTFERAFSRSGGVAQKTLGAADREKNAASSFSIRKDALVSGKKYVIIDDVVTSGATVKACQTLLLSHGAKCAFVLSVSKTPMRGAGYDPARKFRKSRKEKAWFS